MSSINKIEIPLIKANNQNLKGYGYLVDNFDRCKIEIITWPKQGWREIEKGTGNEGGTTEGPFETGFENEEEFSYSPMLDSYKTSTAGYLTEQAALDKRNKKTEVKPQSFKEKYKPKTHWQLQELRRYGL